METLFFQTDSSFLTVQLHPVVLFSILEHYIRRLDTQERVIGAILGVINEGVVEVMDCFGIPHNDGDRVALGIEFCESMDALHRRVNPNVSIVGWYATTLNGQAITSSSCPIHEYFSTMCDNPVHLVVDTSLKRDSLDVKAYTCSSIPFARKYFFSFGFGFSFGFILPSFFSCFSSLTAH